MLGPVPAGEGPLVVRGCLSPVCMHRTAGSVERLMGWEVSFLSSVCQTRQVPYFCLHKPQTPGLFSVSHSPTSLLSPDPDYPKGSRLRTQPSTSLEPANHGPKMFLKGWVVAQWQSACIMSQKMCGCVSNRKAGPDNKDLSVIPATQEAKAGGSIVLGQPGLQE